MTPESGVQTLWDGTLQWKKHFPTNPRQVYDWVSDEHIEFMVIYVMTK